MRSSLNDEPPAGSPDSIHLKVRLPNGQRVARCFNASKSIKVSLSASGVCENGCGYVYVVGWLDVSAGRE